MSEALRLAQGPYWRSTDTLLSSTVTLYRPLSDHLPTIYRPSTATPVRASRGAESDKGVMVDVGLLGWGRAGWDGGGHHGWRFASLRLSRDSVVRRCRGRRSVSSGYLIAGRTCMGKRFTIKAAPEKQDEVVSLYFQLMHDLQEQHVDIDEIDVPKWVMCE